jgi:HAMP domain-containing protein
VVAAYRAAVGGLRLGRGEAAVRGKLAAVTGALGKLPIQRRIIDTSPITRADKRVKPLIAPQERGEPPAQPSDVPDWLGTPREALDQYTITIGALIQVNTEIAAGTDNQRLLEGIDAWIALSRAVDFVDLQRGLLYKVFAQRGFFGRAEHGRLVALNAAEDIDLAQFAGFATPAQRQLLQRAVSGPDVDRAETFKRMALLQEQLHRIEVNPRVWYVSATVKLDRLRQVERRVGADIIATSATLEANARRHALLYSGLLAATVVLAIGLSLVTARSLILPLGRLKDVADEVAQRTLPDVVRRLQDGEVVDLAAEAAGPIQVGSSDEIGHLGEAFNSVHRVAVQLAGGQAALRRSIGDMFLNLARRSQSLIDRQLEVIGALPDADAAALPARVLELDQLATHMRRNAENLIVLSGAEPTRRWRGPVGIGDVVGAAVEEVKERGRVEVVLVQDVTIAGHVAVAVMHLLVELMENAVRFSPPQTMALIAGQSLPAGYLIEVEDRGLGMSDEQLAAANERVASPPAVDLADARMLGFFVVGQLAARHGIKVQLRHSPYAGVTALVLLPWNLAIRSDPSATTSGAQTKMT